MRELYEYTYAWSLPSKERIGPDQIAAVNRATPAVVIGNVVNASIVLASFWTSATLSDVVVWYCLVVTLSGYVGFKWLQRRKRRIRSVSPRFLRRALIVSTMLGIPWGYLAGAYLGAMPHETELILVALCAGMAASGSIYLAPVFPAALAYMTVILLPASAKCLSMGTSGYVLLGVLTLSFAAFLWALICTHARLAMERSEAHANLQDKTSVLRAIVDNFPGGIGYLDRDLRIVVCNQRAKELLELPENFFEVGPPGMQEVLKFNAMRGEYGPGDPQEQIAAKMALYIERKPYHFERRRPNGTVLDVRGAPVANGGFITTYMDITERSKSEERIEHLARHDSLTDLPNRLMFHARLESALGGTRTGDRYFALLLFDLDRFKEVNDKFGHPVGDGLLKAVAKRLRACVREEDLLVRLGGDEFAIVMHIDAAEAEAASLAARICAEIRTPFTVDGSQISVGVSIGISVAPTDGITPDDLIKNADLALYRAKSTGGSGFCFFEEEMDAFMQARRQLEADLSQALSRDEFELHFQPLVATQTLSVVGFEALLRWRREGHVLVAPATFIPLAEETGMIIPIGDWALRSACLVASSWPPHVKVSVNISPAQFKHQDIVRSVADALLISKLDPRRLEIEITETIMLCDSDEAHAKLTALRSLGVRIALDDFGTGYSSLNNLRKFDFDKIKIDRSFIQCAEPPTQKENAILRSMVDLARSLGLSITAEGVETSEQLVRIRAQGCTEIQGYYISRPVSASEVPAFFDTRLKTLDHAA